MSDVIEHLPPAFVSRLRAIVPPAAFSGVADTFATSPPTCFRVNTLLGEVERVTASLRSQGLHLRAVPWLPEAFWVAPEERAALLASDAYAACLIYVQNASSMVPPLVLAPQPGERVLDLAAAPGSKTLQIAAMMAGQGELAAVEPVKGRFFKLRANVQAFGATNVRTFMKDGTHVWRHRPAYFDRVLLDAPCSTEGRFHVSVPASYAYWKPAKIKEMVRKQRRLLFSAIQCLRPGGVLVYSTCTFAPEENEGVVDWALGKFADVSIERIDLTLPSAQQPLGAWQGKRYRDEVKEALRILPTETMEAFFVARLRKGTI